MHPIVFLPLFIVAITVISACSAPKGSIVILENPKGEGFAMDFKRWSLKDKCELSLSRGDVLQVEVIRVEGEIDFEITGKNGSRPYTGNNLNSGVFTVTVPEADTYEMRIAGKGATGKVAVYNMNNTEDVFYCKTLECSFSFPQSWKNKYEIEENDSIVYVYHKGIREKYGVGTGLLFYIEMLQGENLTHDDITDPGNRTIALQEGGYTYVFGMPTDIQYPIWEGGDKALADDYVEMAKDCDTIKNSMQRP